METIQSAVEAERLTDEELVLRILRGEKQWFQAIMRRNSQRLFRLLKAYMRDENEAEEALQEGFVHAYEHLDQFQGKSKLSTWLTRIIINEALSRMRARKRLVSIDDASSAAEMLTPVSDPGQSPESQAMRKQLRARLEEALDSLPHKYRIVFVLRQVKGMSTCQTAARLSIGEEAVKTRLFRARAALRDRLKHRTRRLLGAS